MPMTKRCENCGGKISLLQKTTVWRMGRAVLKEMETYQPYRCKRCGYEGRIKKEKSKKRIKLGDFIDK